MGRKLKVRIETAGITNEAIARLVREIARRIDDGRVRGIIEWMASGGAWTFEDDLSS